MDAVRIAPFVLVCLAMAASAAAEETPAQKSDAPSRVTVFRGAEIDALPTGQKFWPETLRGSDAEGWATLSMMIDQRGKPYEIAVYESSEAVAKIEAARTGNDEWSLAGEIGTGASWFGQLFRDWFAIAVGTGKVEEIKLRCQQRFVFFKFDPAIRYRVPPEYGNCGIEVVGDPGTQFELIQ